MVVLHFYRVSTTNLSTPQMLSAIFAFASLAIFDLRAPEHAKSSEAIILSIISAAQAICELWDVSPFSILITLFLGTTIAMQFAKMK